MTSRCRTRIFLSAFSSWRSVTLIVYVVTTSSAASCYDVIGDIVSRRHQQHRVTTSLTAPRHDVIDADMSRRNRQHRVTTSSAASCFLFEDANTTWLHASCLPQCVLNALTPSLMPWVELNELLSWRVHIFRGDRRWGKRVKNLEKPSTIEVMDQFPKIFLPRDATANLSVLL